MAAPEPIQRRKLSDEVTRRLLALIEERRLRPGDPLPSERELMDLYGVGRPSVREAMQDLARQGVVTIQHGERSKVAAPTLDSVIDQMRVAAHRVLANSPATLDHLKEARLTFELEMVRRAAGHATPAQIDALAERIEDQRQAIKEPRAFLGADGRFHREVAAIDGNPIYPALSEALFGWLTEFHRSLVRVPGLEGLAVEEHERVLAAIADHDVGAAEQAMRAHLMRANALYARFES